MNLLKASGTIGGMTLLSRLFGFVRDILLARILGAGMVADAWQLAFQLPNIFRRLFAEGAFSVAFVPLFNRELSGGKDSESDDPESARQFVTETVSILVPVLLLFSIIFELAMPGFIWLIGEEFRNQPDKFNLAVALARITFPYLFFISLVAMLTGILNSISRFAAAAAAPILLNICMIGALLLGSSLYGVERTLDIAFVLAWGVALAGLLQFLWLYFWVRRTPFHLKIIRPRLTPRIRELGRLILPVTFGAGIYQISRFVDLFFLGRLAEGSFTYLAMADRLNQLPLGIIGIALGTAILPALSRFIARDDKGGAQRIQSNAVELAMLITIPAAAALFVTAPALVTAIFVGGNFTAADGQTTAMVVSALVSGLPAYVLLKVLSPGFFARGDTKTPVFSAAAALAINVTLNLLLIPIFGIVGLALAGATAAWCNCAILYTLLHKRNHYRLEGDLILRLLRIIISAAAMSAALYFLLPVLSIYYSGNILERALSVGLLVISGMIVYFGLAWLIGAIDRKKIAMLTGKQKPASDTGSAPTD